MSAFGWLKRVLFGAESLTKSGIEKGKEAGSRVVERGKDRFGEVQEELGDVVDAARDKFDNLFDKAGDRMEEGLSSAKRTASQAGEKAESLGKKMASDSRDAGSKISKKIEDLSDDVVEASDKAWDRIADTTSNLYQKAKDKAEEVSGKLGEKMEDLMDKAEADAAAEKAYDEQHPTGIYEGESHNEKLKGSMLDGTDDFFEKADAFAKGNYEKASEGKVTIHTPSESEKKQQLQELLDSDEASKTDDASSGTPEAADQGTHGFEDADGDGDEITDDATIVDEEE